MAGQPGMRGTRADRRMANDSFDTIIIGGGMSGLAAGIRLAYFDQRVCILERHSVLGGLNSFYRLGGREYDVGLHAITNYAPRGAKGKPLTKLLRQLRIGWDELQLEPQIASSIAFPGARLRFTNDFEVFRQEVVERFPSQADAFARLVREVDDFDELDLSQKALSARAVVGSIVTDPLLVEMLFCPILFYGSAREDDIDWNQFVIMFKSIFREGLARPRRGVRRIIKLLAQKYKKNGGLLRTRCGVHRLVVERGKVCRVVLDNGAELSADHVLSSAGLVETMSLCDDHPPTADHAHAGRLSFIESISIVDRVPAEFGHEETIVFFNDDERFRYRRPDDLIDPRSGVICSPNNFRYAEPLPEGVMRVTTLADFDRWNGLDAETYAATKLACHERALEVAVKFVPDFRRFVVETDIFTPTTIKKFTGHLNGAVYGAPVKRLDGRTHLDNLFLCGSDQGFLGIVGAVLSGITIANRYLLNPP